MRMNPFQRVRTQRASRLSRGVRRALLASGLALAVLVVAVTVIRQVSTRSPAHSRAATAGASAEAGGDTCERRPTREPCKDLVVDGVTRRYALLPADAPTTDTVIVDFGGPGHAVLSGENHLVAFRAAYKAIASRYNILAIEEPWVTQPVTEPCAARLSAYYTALHSSSVTAAESEGSRVPADCGVASGTGRWGYTPASYTSVVRAIEKHDQIRVRGFVGHSWGAVRMTYLDRSLDFAALVRPFPVGVSADRLTDARSQLTATIPAAAAQAAPAQVQGRSLPITVFDRLSAVVGLGYVDDAHLEESRAEVSAGHDTPLTGSLSDQLWKRYGVSSVSPALLAQLDEMCPVAGTLPGAPETISSAHDVLAAQLIPCRSVPQRAVTARTAAKTCVVSSRFDSVVPDALVRSAFTRENVMIMESTEHSHGSFDGLDRCLATLLR